jgi:hypothetical protein
MRTIQFKDGNQLAWNDYRSMMLGTLSLRVPTMPLRDGGHGIKAAC